MLLLTLILPVVYEYPSFAVLAYTVLARFLNSPVRSTEKKFPNDLKAMGKLWNTMCASDPMLESNLALTKQVSSSAMTCFYSHILQIFLCTYVFTFFLFGIFVILINAV